MKMLFSFLMALVAVTCLQSERGYAVTPIRTPTRANGIGVVLVSYGKVYVQKTSSSKPILAEVGSIITPGSLFLTGVNSRLKLVMKDGSEFDLTENSRLWVESFAVGNSGRLGPSVFHLDAGVVRAQIVTPHQAQEEALAVVVKTPNAVQSLIRGEMVVVYDSTQKISQIICMEGQTHLGAWTDRNNRVMSPLLVSSGMFSKVTRSGHVVVPRKMTARLLAGWREQAQIKITAGQLKLAMGVLKSVPGSPGAPKRSMAMAQRRLPAKKGSKRGRDEIKTGPVFDGDDEPLQPRVVLRKKAGAASAGNRKHQPEKRRPASVDPVDDYDSMLGRE